jgi:hypothetical protein
MLFMSRRAQGAGHLPHLAPDSELLCLPGRCNPVLGLGSTRSPGDGSTSEALAAAERANRCGRIFRQLLFLVAQPLHQLPRPQRSFQPPLPRPLQGATSHRTKRMRILQSAGESPKDISSHWNSGWDIQVQYTRRNGTGPGTPNRCIPHPDVGTRRLVPVRTGGSPPPLTRNGWGDRAVRTRHT